MPATSLLYNLPHLIKVCKHTAQKRSPTAVDHLVLGHTEQIEPPPTPHFIEYCSLFYNVLFKKKIILMEKRASFIHLSLTLSTPQANYSKDGRRNDEVAEESKATTKKKA